MLPESAGTAAEALALIGDQRSSLFIGNGARLYRDTIQSRLGAQAVLAEEAHHDLQPGVAAQLGSQLLDHGAGADVNRFAPVYLRSADAQLPATPTGPRSGAKKE
jgi:tRNA threonylcarbamoyladenosine biosynthesis protein TsaB